MKARVDPPTVRRNAVDIEAPAHRPGQPYPQPLSLQFFTVPCTLEQAAAHIQLHHPDGYIVICSGRGVTGGWGKLMYTRSRLPTASFLGRTGATLHIVGG